MRNRLWIFTATLLVLWGAHTTHAQQIKWLRVGDLQSFFNEIGAEYECEGPSCTNHLDWPSQYGVGSLVGQHNCRARGLWIGCKNFNDPVEGKIKSVKVIGSGPRDFADRTYEIFEKEFKLIGRTLHPNVIVDNQHATVLDTYDQLDETDPTLPADRELLIRFNTSIGISVTKRVYAFANSSHGNYFIHDYVFTNTGIYDRQGHVQQQTLDSVWFFFTYRYAFNGATTASRAGSSWGAFATEWGASTINHTFGEDPTATEFNDPTSPIYKMRGFYSWYGPEKDSPRPSYAEDWGCPNQNKDGWLGSAKYAGCVTLHADTSPQDQTDDPYQPRTTWFISSDISIMSAGVSQYNELFMADKYTAMTEGHPPHPHDYVIGDSYAQDYSDPRRQAGGGTSQDQSYGPYRLAPGDSIHIVFAEGVSGLSWEACGTIGANWLSWRNNSPVKPQLYLPNGDTTTNYNLYKRRWCETGKDSILQTFQRATKNFSSGYTIKNPPGPPGSFAVTSGGSQIHLEWAASVDESATDFDGYVVYRSEGLVLDFQAVYVKIFECNKSNVVHSFDDVTAKRGFDYYYYVQSKDDGTRNTVDPGRPLYSSLFWTVTSVAANLQRPAATGAWWDSVRVVPNPYDIRARLFQFGTKSQYDRIAFYGLPPTCKLRIYTENGELIWEKEHTRGTGDELWNSTTSSGQIIASGIYILYVEAPDGKTVFRKFVVIR